MNPSFDDPMEIVICKSFVPYLQAKHTKLDSTNKVELVSLACEHVITEAINTDL